MSAAGWKLPDPASAEPPPAPGAKLKTGSQGLLYTKPFSVAEQVGSTSACGYTGVQGNPLCAFRIPETVHPPTTFSIQEWLPVKILGDGELKTALTVTAHKFSKSAQEKITKAGGKFEVLQ